jgi:hypothetical protein
MKSLPIIRFWFAVAPGLLFASPVMALDFTPQETWRALEGVRVPVLMFSDPTGRIRYQPPGNWNVNGSGSTLALYPPDARGAFMKLLVLRHAAGIPEITALSSDDLVKWSQSYLATDAQDAKLLGENPSPFMLNGKSSREFVFNYKSGGQRLQTSVAVLDWTEREHLAVVITALAPEFKAVHDAGTASLFSWSLRKADPPKPGPPPGPTAAIAPGLTPIGQ